MVTLCLPTVTSVPGGRVPAGTVRVGITEAAVEAEAALERFARDEEWEV